MRVAIVGSRDWPDPQQIVEFVASLDPEQDVVVSGQGGLVDLAAEVSAQGFGIPTLIFPALWRQYGRAAGPRRNTLIVSHSDEVHAWWDGRSRGTGDSIKKARAAGKLGRVTLRSSGS